MAFGWIDPEFQSYYGREWIRKLEENCLNEKFLIPKINKNENKRKYFDYIKMRSEC